MRITLVDPLAYTPPYDHSLAQALGDLERMVAAKGVTNSDMLARYHDAWDRAADRTPHGTPIELRPEDFAS